ncbi:MAG: tail fiber domain-containing protein [Verrucomicrobiales bacterium]|nr:tail fiber domain-containing protein [Verrucomicrobiales bacterium]
MAPAWAVLLLAHPASGATPPNTLQFQGRVSVEGTPFTGDGRFRFALIDRQGAAVWANAKDANPADGIPDSTVILPVNKGLYGVTLGSEMEPFPSRLFADHADLQLRVWFDDGTHGSQQLSPDQPLAPVPYAHHSASADHANRADVAATAEVAKSLAGNPTFAGDTTFEGNVGIGTQASSAATLQVAGTLKADSVSVHRSYLTCWGEDRFRFGPAAAELIDVVAISMGPNHGLAIRRDGTVAAWGDFNEGQIQVPPGLKDVIAVAAGGRHSLALRSDGTIVGWGLDAFEESVPQPDLSGVIAIACGVHHSLALKSDGTVAAWGDNGMGQADVPSNLGQVVAIAAGGDGSLALRADGSVIASGSLRPRGNPDQPVMTGATAIATSGDFSLAIKADGTVVSWGVDPEGIATPPRGLDQVIAIACGSRHSIALKKDGTVVSWGDYSKSATMVPPGLKNVVAISAGGLNNVALSQAELTDFASLSVRPYFTDGVVASADVTEVAVHGRNTDPAGWAGYFEGKTYFSGPVGIGVEDPINSLDVLGDVVVTPTNFGAGVTVVGNGVPAAFTLRDRNDDRGYLGVAADRGQYSENAEVGDITLRTAGTGNRLLLQNGNGAAALVVRNNRVGIGVTDPDAPLSIRRDTANPEFGYCVALNDRDGTPLWKIGADNGKHFSIGAAGLRDRDIAINRNNGDVRVSKNLFVNGTVNAAAYNQTSDARRKTDVRPVDGALQSLEALRGVSFAWKQENSEAPNSTPGSRQLGFIAQEVATVLPDLVRTNADGFLSMNYDGVTPVLVEGVKSLKHWFDQQLARKDSEIASLRARLAQVEESLEEPSRATGATDPLQ